jgi:DNA-binding FrmR family transcriptional regulator
MINKSNDPALIALKKARTSINNVIKMIESDAYCIDVVQQILAVNGLLKSASSKVLQNHLNTCFSDGIESKNKVRKEILIEELINVINLRNRN